MVHFLLQLAIGLILSPMLMLHPVQQAVPTYPTFSVSAHYRVSTTGLRTLKVRRVTQRKREGQRTRTHSALTPVSCFCRKVTLYNRVWCLRVLTGRTFAQSRRSYARDQEGRLLHVLQ